MAVKLFKYESDLDTSSTSGTSIIGQLRGSEFTAGLTIASIANDAPEADINSNIPIRVSSTRKYGIIARHIVLKRFDTTPTPNKIVIRRIPVLKPSTFIQYISGVSESVTYDGLEDWVIVGAENERFRLFLSPSV